MFLFVFFFNIHNVLCYDAYLVQWEFFSISIFTRFIFSLNVIYEHSVNTWVYGSICVCLMKEEDFIKRMWQ